MTWLRIGMTAGSLALAGGAVAQETKTEEPSRDRSMRPAFVTGDTLIGVDVMQRDREAGSVDDLVVDTRNGRVAYAVIDTDEVLGIGGRTIVVPYGAFAWDAENSRLAMRASSEDLKNLPPFQPDDLAHLEDPSWLSTLRGVFGDRSEIDDLERRHRYDGYTRLFERERAQRVRGTVVGINREARTPWGRTYYAVMLEDEANAERQTVVLAPMRFLAAEDAVLPKEGDVVTVQAVPAHDADGRAVLAARSFSAEGRVMQLRDEKGVPAWQMREPGGYYALASTLDEGALRAQGKEFGSVDDIVIEARSGTVAYAVISAGGMLGIDDTSYPVPCAVLMRGPDGDLLIDMPVEKLRIAPKLSEDGTRDLDSPAFREQVRSFFEIENEPYDPGRARRWMAEATARPVGR